MAKLVISLVLLVGLAGSNVLNSIEESKQDAVTSFVCPTSNSSVRTAASGRVHTLDGVASAGSDDEPDTVVRPASADNDQRLWLKVSVPVAGIGMLGVSRGQDDVAAVALRQHFDQHPGYTAAALVAGAIGTADHQLFEKVMTAYGISPNAKLGGRRLVTYALTHTAGDYPQMLAPLATAQLDYLEKDVDQTPVLIAITQDRERMATTLLDRPQRLNLEHNSSLFGTALIAAARARHLSVVEKLCARDDRAAYLDLKCPTTGETALIAAVGVWGLTSSAPSYEEVFFAPAVAALLSAGANPELRNGRGRTAYQTAKRHGRARFILEQLRQGEQDWARRGHRVLPITADGPRVGEPVAKHECVIQ